MFYNYSRPGMLRDNIGRQEVGRGYSVVLIRVKPN